MLVGKPRLARPPPEQCVWFGMTRSKMRAGNCTIKVSRFMLLGIIIKCISPTYCLNICLVNRKLKEKKRKFSYLFLSSKIEKKINIIKIN